MAAAVKHFPGLGEADLDSHLGLPVVEHDRARLDATELVPFAAAIEAGADLVMSAHIGLPALTGDADLPATLSREVMHDLVRDGLGFRGLTITDALDMEALPQGSAQVVDVIAAIRAGVDLLLCAPDPERLARIEGAVAHAAATSPVRRRGAARIRRAALDPPRAGSRRRPAPASRSSARPSTAPSPARSPSARSPSSATATGSCRSGSPRATGCSR